MNARFQRAERALLTTLLRDLETGRVSAHAVVAAPSLDGLTPDECIDLVRLEIIRLNRAIRHLEAGAFTFQDSDYRETLVEPWGI